MKKPNHQRELPLTDETVLQALPKEIVAKCRQLIGQMLLEFLQLEKEERDE